VKLIQCIIRPEKLNDLVERIEGYSSGLTVSDVRGHGHQKGQSTVYRGLEYQVSLLPKTMVEIVADESRVDDIVKIVSETARTGQIGDGRIFILDVDEVYHIRTGAVD
jgi:nitrogen regulatory protein P-II 1